MRNRRVRWMGKGESLWSCSWKATIHTPSLSSKRKILAILSRGLDKPRLDTVTITPQS